MVKFSQQARRFKPTRTQRVISKRREAERIKQRVEPREEVRSQASIRAEEIEKIKAKIIQYQAKSRKYQQKGAEAEGDRADRYYEKEAEYEAKVDALQEALSKGASYDSSFDYAQRVGKAVVEKQDYENQPVTKTLGVRVTGESAPPSTTPLQSETTVSYQVDGQPVKFQVSDNQIQTRQPVSYQVDGQPVEEKTWKDKVGYFKKADEIIHKIPSNVKRGVDVFFPVSEQLTTTQEEVFYQGRDDYDFDTTKIIDSDLSSKERLKHFGEYLKYQGSLFTSPVIKRRYGALKDSETEIKEATESITGSQINTSDYDKVVKNIESHNQNIVDNKWYGTDSGFEEYKEDYKALEDFNKQIEIQNKKIKEYNLEYGGALTMKQKADKIDPRIGEVLQTTEFIGETGVAVELALLGQMAGAPALIGVRGAGVIAGSQVVQYGTTKGIQYLPMFTNERKYMGIDYNKDYTDALDTARKDANWIQKLGSGVIGTGLVTGFGESGKTFRRTVTKQADDLGLTGQDKVDYINAQDTKSYSKTFGQMAGLIAISVGSEALGNRYVSQATKTAGHLAKTKWGVFKLTAPPIAKAGIVEGFGSSMIIDVGESKIPTFDQALSGAVIGGVSAGVIGGTIAGLSTGGKTAQLIGTGVEDTAYSIDPYEWFGDYTFGKLNKRFNIIPVVEGMGIGKGLRLKVSTGIPAFTSGITPTISSPSITPSVSTSIPVHSTINAPTSTHTITQSNLVKDTLTSSNTLVNIPTTIASDVTIPTTIDTSIPTETTITNTIETTTNVPVETFTTVPVMTPMLRLPALPFGFGGGGGGKRKKKRARSFGRAYLPSFSARALGLKPMKVTKSQAMGLADKELTGLEIRRAIQLVGGTTKKRKGKRRTKTKDLFGSTMPKLPKMPKMNFGLPKGSMGLPKMNFGLSKKDMGLPKKSFGLPKLPKVNLGLTKVRKKRKKKRAKKKGKK